MERNIVVGERVFDAGRMLAGFVVDIVWGISDEEMHYQLRADDEWNKKFMDLDSEKDDALWWTDDENDVYQFADGIVDARNGYDVCIEHMPTMDDYPYYCPVTGENLFGYEVI